MMPAEVARRVYAVDKLTWQVPFSIRPNELIISESTAKKYFGNQDPINNTIEVDQKEFKIITEKISREQIYARNVCWYP